MFFCFLLLLALLVYEYLGSWIVRRVLSGTLGSAFSIVFFPFKKCYKLCCGRGRPAFMDKEFNPPFTKDFVRGYPLGSNVPHLSAATGWSLTKTDAGLHVHTKIWLESGEHGGVGHAEGQPKRTWEAIRDTQVHTYNIRSNPGYTDAMIAKDELTIALETMGGGEGGEGEWDEGGGGGKGIKVVPVS